MPILPKIWIFGEWFAENTNNKLKYFEPKKEAKICGNVIEIPGLQSSENDIKSPSGGGGIKKKVTIGKGQKTMTDFFKKN